MVESPVRAGIYEIRRARGASRRKARAGVVPRPQRKAHEQDLGFSQSHGYGPAHGGPSGPGDVPADESTALASSPEAELHRPEAAGRSEDDDRALPTGEG
jgi:hypothetical protein